MTPRPCAHPEHVLVCANCGEAIAIRAGALDEVIDRFALLPGLPPEPAEAPA